MKNETDEFSFILRPSKYGGVGVFATHDIKKGTHLRLLGDEKDYIRIIKISDVKDKCKDLISYCVVDGDELICPKDFGRPEMGWFLNHSKKNPNTYFSHNDYQYYALKDIKKDEEILIDYNEFNEPEEYKKDFYHN